MTKEEQERESLCRSALAHWQNHSQYEDLLQELRLLCWQRWDKLQEFTPGTRVMWLRFRAIDIIRKATGGRSTTKSHEARMAVAAPVHYALIPDDLSLPPTHDPDHHLTQEAIDLIPTDPRMRFIVLALAVGYSNVEISRMLGVTESAVTQYRKRHREAAFT